MPAAPPAPQQGIAPPGMHPVNKLDQVTKSHPSLSLAFSGQVLACSPWASRPCLIPDSSALFPVPSSLQILG